MEQYWDILEEKMKEDKELISEILANEKNYKPNPLSSIKKNEKPRPYTVNDFKKKYFITNIIE